jgi:hypothetical protein
MIAIFAGACRKFGTYEKLLNFARPLPLIIGHCGWTFWSYFKAFLGSLRLSWPDPDYDCKWLMPLSIADIYDLSCVHNFFKFEAQLLTSCFH